jgi:hypothetical protein
MEKRQVIRDWLDDLVEDQLEVSDKYKDQIERAKSEIASGLHTRTRQTPAE